MSDGKCILVGTGRRLAAPVALDKWEFRKMFSGAPKKFSIINMHRRARFWGRMLARLPGVAAIFLSGSLSQERATATSDIDFFIVARPGRIFTARFGVLVTLLACGRLAHGEKNHAGKICPNHFITTDNLEILEKGYYYAHLFANNRLLAGERAVWERFKTSNRDWIRSHGFDFREPVQSLLPEVKKSRRSRAGDLLERGFGELQRLKHQMSCPPRSECARVWLTDAEIRLHPHALEHGNVRSPEGQ